jgi:hypothetical protein
LGLGVSGHRLEIPFDHAGRRGSVSVTVVPSADPLAIGKPEEDAGFPVCTATVELAQQGYRAFCGWVQLVRSTDNSSSGREFEMDPLGPFLDNPSPFCFFGLAPTLFDAPSRDSRDELDWVAHSFLAVDQIIEERRGVRPLLGLEWGFTVSSEGSIEIREPAQLDLAAWNDHLPVLTAAHPTWEFPPEPGSV